MRVRSRFALVASVLVLGLAAGCDTKMSTGSGKDKMTEGGKMDKDKMDKDKMEGGKMDGGKMDKDKMSK